MLLSKKKQDVAWKQEILKCTKTLDFFNPVTSPSISEAAYFTHYHLHCVPYASEHRFGYLTAQNFHIATHLWQPKKKIQGTAFIVHGYFDHIGLYQHLIEFLLNKNLAVVGFDLPGHGLSTGEQVQVECFSTYQAVLAKIISSAGHLPGPFYLLGQSTGASIALQYLLNCHALKTVSVFSQVFLLAPLIRPVHWSWVYVLAHCLKPFIKRFPRNFSSNSHDEGFVDFIKNHDPLQARAVSLDWLVALARWIKMVEKSPPTEFSTVMVQGGQDTTVDWKYNIRLLNKLLPNSKTKYLPYAKHHLVNESPAIRERCFAELAKYL